MRGLSQNLGLQVTRPGSFFDIWPAAVYSWVKGNRQCQDCKTSAEGRSDASPEKKARHGGGGGGPLPPNRLSRNPWLLYRTAVVGVREAPSLSACPGPLAKRTRCSLVRWPPPSGAGRLPNRCLSSLPAPHSPAAPPRLLPPL